MHWLKRANRVQAKIIKDESKSNDNSINERSWIDSCSNHALLFKINYLCTSPSMDWNSNLFFQTRKEQYSSWIFFIDYLGQRQIESTLCSNSSILSLAVFVHVASLQKWYHTRIFLESEAGNPFLATSWTSSSFPQINLWITHIASFLAPWSPTSILLLTISFSSVPTQTGRIPIQH